MIVTPDASDSYVRRADHARLVAPATAFVAFVEARHVQSVYKIGDLNGAQSALPGYTPVPAVAPAASGHADTGKASPPSGVRMRTIDANKCLCQ